MKPLPVTRLAVLGLPAGLGQEPIPFDLDCLRTLVTGIEPDLLCAEITHADWEAGNLAQVEAGVREALAPVVASSDIVLVPVIPTTQHFDDFAPVQGWRRKWVQALARLLRWGQRLAGGAEAINGLAFGAFCHTVCGLTEMFWTVDDRRAWQAQNKALADNILTAVQRDPGRRILVVVQCQRLHQLLPRLHDVVGNTLMVDYRRL